MTATTHSQIINIILFLQTEIRGFQSHSRCKAFSLQKCFPNRKLCHITGTVPFFDLQLPGKLPRRNFHDFYMIRRFFILTAICRFQICIRLIMKSFFPAAGFPCASLMPGSQPHFSFICKYLSIRLFCCLFIDLPFSAKNISRLPLYFRFPSGSLPDFSPHPATFEYSTVRSQSALLWFLFSYPGKSAKNNDREIFFHIRHPLCQDPLRSINGCRRKIRKNNC